MYKIGDKVILETSRDGLQGYITILDSDIALNKNILNEIKEYFKFGLDQDLLRPLLETKCEKTLIAEGKDSVNGENGYIDYKFELNRVIMPKINNDGIVDYRELDSINKVYKDQLLALIIEPTCGEIGKKVTGEDIACKRGRTPKFRVGKNVIISNDGMSLNSGVDGLVEVKNGRVNVLELLNVDNVDTSIGNIDFKGNVIVNKDILNGFTVKSEGSVEVKGAVEGGYIKCDGDILVRRGIQGYNRLAVEANGNLSTKFIENACINVKGNITSESIMHSDVTSRSNILMLGRNGLIVGGICRANHEIIAKVIGSSMATKTVLEVGVDPEIKDEQEKLEKELKLSDENLDKLDKSLLILDRLKRSNKLDENKLQLYNELLNAKESVYFENKRIKNNLLQIKEKIDRLSNGKIRVSDTIHPGSKIIIGNAYLNIKRKMQKCTFYSQDGEIRIGAY